MYLDNNHEKIKKIGGIQAIIAGMRYHVESSEVHHKGFKALRNLSQNGTLYIC